MTDFTPEPYGPRLLKLRESHNTPRHAFADALKIPLATLKNYELQYRKPPASLIEQVFHVFGEKWALWVLTGQGDHPAPISNLLPVRKTRGTPL